METIKIIGLLVLIIIIGYFIYRFFKKSVPSTQKVNNLVIKSNILNVLNNNNQNSDYYEQLIKLKNMYKINIKNAVPNTEKEKINNIFLNSKTYQDINNILLNSDTTLKELETNINLTNGQEKEALQNSYNSLKNSIENIKKEINEILNM